MSKTTTTLPAIRSRVGDWNYYVTTLTFSEIKSLITSPDELHERKRLADWIQREAIEKHEKEIATYILNTPQRFLGSIIVGVYGGSPDWIPISIKIPDEEGLTEEEQMRIGENLGLLHFSGKEKLFAIDGQHRVAGIKSALKSEPNDERLKDDSISAIFVGHDKTSEEGKMRTRRLFTTVNKRAKVVSKAARIALDEDDGYSIVTRQLIDRYWLFEDSRQSIVYVSTGAIPGNNQEAITSVVGLYELIKDIYGPPLKKGFENSRPSDASIEEYLTFCIDYFEELMTRVPEYKKVFKQKQGKAGDYRLEGNNHMLFRPAGQRAFNKALQLLLERGKTLQEGMKILLKVDLYLDQPHWHYKLWDPVGKTMITTKLSLAETQLLRLAGQEPRTKRHGENLNTLERSIVQK